MEKRKPKNIFKKSSIFPSEIDDWTADFPQCTPAQNHAQKHQVHAPQHHVSHIPSVYKRVYKHVCVHFSVIGRGTFMIVRLRIAALKDSAKHFIHMYVTHHGTVHRHRQRTLLPKMGPLILKSAGGPFFTSPKTETGPLAHTVFSERAENGRKHNVKMRVPLLKNRCMFAMCKFPCLRNKLPFNHVSNNAQFGVDPLGASKDFRIFKLSCFFLPPKGSHFPRFEIVRRKGPVAT